MSFLQITPIDNKQMFETLSTAFTPSELRIAVKNSVPEIAGELSENIGIRRLVAEVVEFANQHGVLDRFIVAVAAERPGRPDLRGLVLALSQRSGWGALYGRNGLSSEGLERLTSRGDPFIDVGRLARWMIGVENHVCQVRCGDSFGTGFLIASDLVLTNYHVVESHLKGLTGAADVQVRFDFRISPTGAWPNTGAPFRDIDPAWAIPSRPYSQADITLQGLPAATELDYAILKLMSAAGLEDVPDRGRRGWVDISQDAPIPAREAPILIVQHPGQLPDGRLPQQPLKISFATPGFEEANSNRTRVRYRSSTLKGSSGSPVFGPDYRAVALHHNRGQVSNASVDLDRNNTGIPLTAIRADLRARSDLATDVLGMLLSPS